MSRLTKCFHFVWFSNELTEMSYLQYLSIMSIVENCSPDSINLFTDVGFKGKLWKKVKPYVNIYQIDRPEFTSIGNSYSKFVAYSDIVRNLIIKEYGGIYCDFDIIWTKPIDNLLNEIETLSSSDPIYAIGEQGKNGCEGLNMGVIIGEKNNLFCNEYLKFYSQYDELVKEPADHIRIYSTSLPLQILKNNPNLGIILPYNYFHWPLYHVTKNWFLAGDHHLDLKDSPKYSKWGGGYWSNEPINKNSYAHHCFFLDGRLKDNEIKIDGFNEQKQKEDLKKNPSDPRAGSYSFFLDMTVKEFIENVNSGFTQICKPLLKYL